MVTDFLAGMHFFRLGCQDLLRPKLRQFLIIPLIINLIIFGLLFYFGFHLLAQKLNFITNYTLPHWLSWLQWLAVAIKYLIMTVLLLGSIVIYGIVATLGANLLGAPFNGVLSERCSKHLGMEVPTQPTLIKMSVNAIGREGRKFLYYLPRAIGVVLLCCVLYFIPPLNLLIPFIFYAFGAWVMAIQYIDYPADNFQISFLEMLALLKKNRNLCLGFGLAASLLSSVPIINFIVMPASVLGATRVWQRINEKRNHGI